jgi:filamentous hemagglutinin family protein
MKRTLIISIVLLALVVSGFAQTGDARAKGLAGAMTAVGDDMNALFYNPAGLAFLRKGYLNIEGNAALTTNRSFDEPYSDALVDIYAVNGEGNIPVFSTPIMRVKITLPHLSLVVPMAMISSIWLSSPPWRWRMATTMRA